MWRRFCKRGKRGCPNSNRAAADLQGMQEGNTMNESEPVVFVTLSTRQWTAMSKFVKSMAPYCIGYNVEVMYLMDEHELGVGKALTEKVFFVLADPRYILKKNSFDAY